MCLESASLLFSGHLSSDGLWSRVPHPALPSPPPCASGDSFFSLGFGDNTASSAKPSLPTGARVPGQHLVCVCVLWALAVPSLYFHPRLRNIDFWCDYVSVLVVCSCWLCVHWRNIDFWCGCLSVLVACPGWLCPCWLYPCLLCVHSRNVDFRCGCVSVLVVGLCSLGVEVGAAGFLSVLLCTQPGPAAARVLVGLNLVVSSWLPDPQCVALAVSACVVSVPLGPCWRECPSLLSPC